MMYVVKSFVKSFENSYSFYAGSENIGIPRPPNLGRRDINLLSMSEQFMPPVIAGKYSVLIISSNFFEFVLYVWCRPNEVYRFMFQSFDETRVRCVRFTPRFTLLFSL